MRANASATSASRPSLRRRLPFWSRSAMPICGQRVPCLARALRRLGGAAGEALQRHVERLLLDPGGLAANRSSCSASTPTPNLSAVLLIASAAEIERSVSAPRPPTVGIAYASSAVTACPPRWVLMHLLGGVVVLVIGVPPMRRRWRCSRVPGSAASRRAADAEQRRRELRHPQAYGRRREPPAGMRASPCGMRCAPKGAASRATTAAPDRSSSGVSGGRLMHPTGASGYAADANFGFGPAARDLLQL